MRIFLYFVVGSLMISSACSSTKTSLFGKPEEKKENVQGTSIKRTLMPATPIKEVEEKLVANEDKAPSAKKYFVVIGSFRDPGNAKEHQVIVAKDGFKSEILKNDAGLYRVSVMETNDITAARNEIRRIWSKFPKYSDTWLLIRKDQ